MIFLNRHHLSVTLAVIIGVLFVTAAASATTSLSTNISTDGSLTVNGSSTFGDAAADVNLFTGTLQASTTSMFTSGILTYAGSTFGDAAADVNLFTGTLQASTTSMFTSGILTYAGSTFGDAAADVNLFTGTLQASTTALFTSGFTSYSDITIPSATTSIIATNGVVSGTEYAMLLITDAAGAAEFGSNAFALFKISQPNDTMGFGINKIPDPDVYAFEVNGDSNLVGVASSTSLRVGGNDGAAGLISGIVSGYCTFAIANITASSTGFVHCASASGVRSGDKVFVQATSSLAGNFIIQAASSTAGAISIQILNTGYPVSGGTATGPNSINFWSVR